MAGLFTTGEVFNFQDEPIDADISGGYVDRGVTTDAVSGESLRIIEIGGEVFDFTPLSESARAGICGMFGKQPDGVTDLEQR